ncbi:hypothetical protein AZ09_10020 [Acetobacter aceti 1023]|nr:hypothetical protein AZ09_10020 [Acetobacter aceti 1023]
MSTSLMEPRAQCGDGRILLHVCASVPDNKYNKHEVALLFVNLKETKEQTQQWAHVWYWKGVLSPQIGRHSAQCLCCTGQAGLSAFLLARAQESVLGRCMPYRSVWIICSPNQIEMVSNQLRKEGFLNSFYQFSA